MKTIQFLVLISCLAFNYTYAQNLPGYSLHPVKSIHLEIGTATTSIISFPMSVEEGRCGIPELEAAKIPGFDNVLAVRAAHAFNDTTSLQVITADGSIYDFSITFSLRPSATKFIVRVMPKQGFPDAKKPNVSNTQMISWHVDRIENEKPFLHKTSSKFELSCSLEGTYATDDILFLRFRLTNYSNLSFQPAMMRLYIADRKAAKRSSVQQIEVTPIYSQDLSMLKGNGYETWIVAIHKTTIPDKKKFLLEINEKNGGRNLQLEIPNRFLLKAKLL